MRILPQWPNVHSCPECNELVFHFSEDAFAGYFKGDTLACSSCSAEVDWWEIIHNDMIKSPFFHQAYVLVGGRLTRVEVTLERGTELNLDLSDCGIAKDARILDITTLPYGKNGGWLFPLVMQGSANMPFRGTHTIEHEIKIYPWPSGETPPHTSTVRLEIHWVTHPDKDPALINLIDAFHICYKRHYWEDYINDAILPANVAVEFELNHLLSSFLEEHVSKRRVRSYLQNHATYGPQLNVLLPILMSTAGVPKLPEHIRGLLNRLRGLRNEVAHEGSPESPVSRDDMLRLLCAALFGFKYLRLARKELIN